MNSATARALPTGAPIAKTSPPDATGVAPRERLFDRLDEAASAAAVWISGPAGAGKTSLVASYVRERGLPCLWYQVDAGDADVASFFYYLGRAAPADGGPLPLLTPEYLGGFQNFSRQFFRELFSRFQPPFALVLDDYHEVPATAPLHAVMRDALTEMPRGGRLLVTSRGEPPPTLARFEAARSLRPLGWDDLQLTVEETSRIAAAATGTPTSIQTAESLHRRSGGWAAGVALLLVDGRHAGPSGGAPAASPEAVFDFFASELFDAAEPDLRAFLLRTAFIPALTARTAAAVSGNPDAGSLLAALRKRNYFIAEQAGGDEPVYQYHDLFREFLLSRAKSVLGTENTRAARRNAALALMEAGQAEAAVPLLTAGGFWEDAVKAIAVQAPVLVAQGRGQTLAGWIAALPAPMVEQVPWLQFWRAACAQPFDLIAARRGFEAAFRGFEAAGDDTGLHLAWAGVVGTYIYEWGDFTPLDPWIEWLDRRGSGGAAIPSPEVEARVAAAMAGALLYRQPHHPDIDRWMERALALAQATADAHVRVEAGFQAVLYYYWVSDLARMGIVVEALRGPAGAPDATPLSRIAWNSTLAVHHLLSADYEQALACIREGLDLAAGHGIHVLDHFMLAEGVYGSLLAGDLETAGGFLARIEATLQGTRRLDVVNYHYMRAWFSLVRDDVPHAVEHARAAVRSAVEAGVPYPEAVSRIGLAEALHRQGDLRAAGRELIVARRIARRMRSRHLEFIGLLNSAALLVDRGHPGVGLRMLGNALSLGRHQGYVNVLLWRPRVLADLCARALAAGIEIEYVQGLVKRLRLAPDPSVALPDAWPWPIRIHALGRFAVLRDGEPIQFSGKAQKKPLDLLKAVIALGGREVPERSLTDLLWPDSEGDAAHNALDTTLHRLRKLLGQERAISLRDGRLTLDPRTVWVDAWAFERLLGQIEEALREPGRRRTIDLAGAGDHVLRLYQGAFLKGDAEAPWAAGYRERLHSKVMRCIAMLGKRREDENAPEQAVALYRRGIEQDPIAEDLYRRLMDCLARLGRTAEALDVYRRCRDMLSIVLGIAPSPETEAIRRRLA